MTQYLWNNQILLREFGSHVEQVSQRLKAASLAEADAAGRPVRYLASAKVSKEDIARRIAAEDGISNGPVCVLTSVEPCRSFEIYRNRDTKHLELQPRLRKCLFLYHYLVHPVFGFLNARIQTWFPFSIQMCNFPASALEQQGSEALFDPRELGGVVLVRVLAHAEQLLVGEVTGVDAHLLDVLGRLHSRRWTEVYVRHQ